MDSLELVPVRSLFNISGPIDMDRHGPKDRSNLEPVRQIQHFWSRRNEISKPVIQGPLENRTSPSDFYYTGGILKCRGKHLKEETSFFQILKSLYEPGMNDS